MDLSTITFKTNEVSEWTYLLLLLKPMKFNKGAHILTAGSKIDSLHIIKKGQRI